MSISTLGLFLRHLALNEEVSRLETTSDHKLLAAYESGSGQDASSQAAFTELMQRHGPMVLRTCRRVLKRETDAEDAFQATFIFLSRQARQLRREAAGRQSLGSWLHRVAYRTALQVLRRAVRRESHERQAAAMSPPHLDPVTRASWNEIWPILDTELDALPDEARRLLIACYLQEKTYREVEEELGLPRSSVARHLEKARALLAARLARRGITVSSVLLGVLLEESAKGAVVPAVLLVHTVEAARRFTEQATGIVSENVVRLVKGGLAQMTKGWTHGSMALAGWVALLGAGLIACQSLKAWPDQKPENEPPATVAERPAQQRDKQTRTDCYGDPLPPGALARMGTTRLFSHYTARAEFPSQLFSFSPDGKLLASVTDPRIVVLWDAATGKEMRRLTIDDSDKSRGITVATAALDFAPDGKTLVAVTYAERACLWEVSTGKLLRTVVYEGSKRGHASGKGRVAFLPDGRILAVADVDHVDKMIWESHIWDVTTGKKVRQLSDSNKGKHLMTTAFSPDGKLLATARNGEQSISLWDVATGKEIHCLPLNKANGRGTLSPTLAFSHDGKTKTLAWADDEMVSVWDTATGKLLRRLKAPSGSGTPVAFSPDGKTLVGGREGQLWNVSTGAKVLSLGLDETNVTGALFSPDGKVLAVTEFWTGRIRLWEVATGKEILPRAGHHDGIQAMAYSPDSKTLASTSHDGTVRLWEVATGKELRQLAKQDESKAECSVAYSPDGKMLASLGDVVHLWDTATGKEICHFKEFRQPFLDVERPRSAIISPDGKILAATLGYDRVCLWKVATGEKIYEIRGEHGSTVASWSVAFSPDGRMLAVPAMHGRVGLWEVATGKSIGQLQVMRDVGQLRMPEERVLSSAFSPDGTILAIVFHPDGGIGMGRKVCLLEVASGKEICLQDVAKEKEEGWSLLAFSPDGRTLATVGRQGRNCDHVRLWEVASGKEIARLSGHQARVRSIVFSPDGKTLTSSSDDLTGLVWDVATVAGRLKPIAVRTLRAKALSKEQLEAAWADLANAEAGKAYRAVWTLRAAPKQAVPLLKERVRPVAPVTDPKQLARWISDLDDNSFTVRHKARREIEKLGEVAIPALRQALKGQPALEVKRRLQDLLAELEPKVVGGSLQRIRELRAMQVLESIGTLEARQVLQALAKGGAEASLTRDAQAALARLAKRPPAKP